MHWFVVWEYLFVVTTHQSLISSTHQLKNIRTLTEHRVTVNSLVYRIKTEKINYQALKIIQNAITHKYCGYTAGIQHLNSYQPILGEHNFNNISATHDWDMLLNLSITSSSLYLMWRSLLKTSLLQATRAPQWETEQKNLICYCLHNLFGLCYVKTFDKKMQQCLNISQDIVNI